MQTAITTNPSRATAAWQWLTAIACAALMTYLITPFFIRARIRGQPISCVNNLRQIANAKEQWALETHQPTNAPVIVSAVNHYIKGGGPKCPEHGNYIYGNVDQRPRCSIKGHELP